MSASGLRPIVSVGRELIKNDLAQLIERGIVARTSGWRSRPRYALRRYSEAGTEFAPGDVTGDLPSADRIIAGIRRRAARTRMRP